MDNFVELVASTMRVVQSGQSSMHAFFPSYTLDIRAATIAVKATI